MNYTQENIRNLLLTGHAGTGKTTLVESLLYYTKGTDRFGRVEDGNTVCDFDPEEVKRKASLSLAIAPVEYSGTKLNLIDVPGLFDFELGMHEGIEAAESVIICISARDGLKVGSVKAHELAKKHHKSAIIYVSNVDVENADFYKVFEELKTEFGPSVCPIIVPVEQAGGRVYLNLVRMKAYSYVAGEAREVPMPSFGHRLDGLIAAMSEAVAETDETLMEKYFSGEAFTQEELQRGIKAGIKSGAITPVFCGAATRQECTDQLLHYMKHLMPSPAEAGPVVGENADGETVERECDSTGPLAAYVFKTIADPFIGKLSYVKVLSGVLKADSPLVNSRTGESERLGKLLFLKGKKQIDTAQIPAGDIGALTKLAETKTGDTLCAPGKVFKAPRPNFPIPTLSMALKVKQKGDESKISGALSRLMEEDCTLLYRMNTETTQQIISGLGEQHLDAVVSKLKSKFGVEVELTTPRIAYRESLRKKVKAQGRHKKQSGGHGQFGDVWIEFEPTDCESLVFEENVFGGAVPKNFFPAVEKGLQEAVKYGVLAGYPLVGLKATLVDGSYHPVDSNEQSFKMAAKIAYKSALPQAGPVLLEPIGTLKAYVPDNCTGDVMGEANKRRGRVLGMSRAEDGLQLVEAEMPVAEMHDFTTYLRSLTQGRGYFTFDFARYEPLPANLESKVIEEAKKFMVRGAEEE
ncbi:elongation factor G [Pygmaiobacter massiliensis]|uniref:elongation factor G n=1 Tax=Pygmaiobacter massiliensis TaxID=1917873 RepID=UPI000C7CB4F3|nr:elongation factor G [Pygmaiobacter massiliensis]